jgi:uncharacterized protein DUF4136
MSNVTSNLFHWFLTGALIIFTTVLNAEEHDNKSSNIGESEEIGTTFTWMPSGTFFYDAVRFKDSDIKSMLEDSIIKELTGKGYSFKSPDDSVDFYISYLVILEEKLTDSEMTNAIREYPELNEDDIKNIEFEHGTVIISATKASNNEKFWKNASKHVVNLNMSDELRQQRLQDGARKIMETFPD